MKRKHIWIYSSIGIVLLLIAVAGGYWIGRSGHDKHEDQMTSEPEKATIWTCSMHPQIQQPKPGKCPICGMDLIPLDDDTGGSGPRTLTMSEAARTLAQVEVVPAQRMEVTRTVSLVGKVDYDETKVATIAAWVPGRLDRLYVDYTGIAVKQGDHMVSMYSPEVQTAQQELLQAIEAEKKMRESALPKLRQSATATVDAVREKLRLWGLSQKQIKAIEERRTASDQITINAPIGGIVIHKNAVEGAYVKTGTPIYRIADLRQVWVFLDAYESDLPWLRYGQQVEFTSEAMPGETFAGRISFIDPVLTERSRTVKVRVNVPNEKGRLKPGMFVRGRVKAVLGSKGMVRAPDLAGKWIGPMHPEIVKDEPGQCDVCGMDLVPARELGYISDNEDTPDPLVIPASAALLTGERAVVYVQDGPGRYSGREVVLGPRAGAYYVVNRGLEAGEKVVVNGNFKIDSALQISAKPSMMSPADEDAGTMHDHTDAAPMTKHKGVPAAFVNQLQPVYDAYFEIAAALGNDQFDTAKEHAATLVEELSDIDMKLVQGDAHETWMMIHDDLRKAGRELNRATDVEAARRQFKPLSIAVKRAVKSFGADADTVYINTCPMAFNNAGAEWLQNTAELLNPYFGEMMPRCGERVETINSKPTTKPAEGSHDGH